MYTSHKQAGFSHYVAILSLVVLGVVGFTGWKVYSGQKKTDTQPSQTSTQSSDNSTTEVVAETPKEPDSASTLETPVKVATSDSKQYFYYGAPAGQNNAKVKRIIISLPGHGSTAEQDYAAWLPHIKTDSYALASLNWWDGDGEKVDDYYSPADVNKLSRSFLNQQGYDNADLIILEGFSRGSANSYSVIAEDRNAGSPVFDAAISASGKYQTDFPLSANIINGPKSATLYKNVYWVMACGDKDDNPDRDGCPGMQTAKTFVEAHGATVLGFLEDPDGGHGAFHAGNKGLPQQALKLIAQKILGSN